MILIFSISKDVSTLSVIDWLKYYNKEMFVIYPEDNITVDNILIGGHNDVNFTITKEVNNRQIKVDYSDISSVWFRRGKLSPMNFKIRTQEISENGLIQEAVKGHLNFEYTSTINFIYELLNRKKILNNFFCSRINKMSTLVLAQEIGFSIPKSKIVTTVKEIETFQENIHRIVIKSIQQLFDLKYEGEYYCNYTEEFFKGDLDILSKSFFPTLVQELVEKDFEIRVFYLNGVCYSMAIFSQGNKQTEIDFRKYDSKSPNRTVPYQLAKNIERKIHTLMKALGLNSGSIDLLKTKQNKIIFLEVNPVGQFGMVSSPCGYYLEKEIAKFLI